LITPNKKRIEQPDPFDAFLFGPDA